MEWPLHHVIRVNNPFDHGPSRVAPGGAVRANPSSRPHLDKDLFIEYDDSTCLSWKKILSQIDDYC
jgi:hypothetical protein